MDLSPIQPDWIPGNVSFVVDDIEHEAGWTYDENTFDYIHMRHTLHSVRDRIELFNRVYRYAQPPNLTELQDCPLTFYFLVSSHLKPGGWFEIQEFHYIAGCDDNTCDGPYAWRDFIRYLKDGMANLGTDLHAILKASGELEQAGFESIQMKSYKCPVGPWAKKKKLQECGHILRDVILWGVNGLAKKPFREGLGWTNVQIEMFLVDVRKAITLDVNGLPKHHSYYPFHTIYGRKPLSG